MEARAGKDEADDSAADPPSTCCLYQREMAQQLDSKSTTRAGSHTSLTTAWEKASFAVRLCCFLSRLLGASRQEIAAANVNSSLIVVRRRSAILALPPMHRASGAGTQQLRQQMLTRGSEARVTSSTSQPDIRK